jgi:hypothetical protein
MHTINLNRRLILKTIGAVGTSGAVGALTACGGSSSNFVTTPSIQYFTEPFFSAGSTEITGVRGVTNSSDVFLTGINMDTTTTPTTNYGLLYRGPLLIANVNSWNKIGPAKTIIKKIGTETSSGLNFYGPNNGTVAGSIVVAGNYNLASSSNAFGLLYQGDINGNGIYTKIDPSSLITLPGVSLANTIAHSNMNSYVVGNYDTSDLVGHAFIMAMGNTPNDPNTYTYIEIPPSLVTGGAISMTAYGIWYNASQNNYTIAGGYSKLIGDKGLSVGYLVDWDPVNRFSNFTSIYYNNDPLTSKVSHIEGITTDNAGGYYLSIDWAATVATASATGGAALVQVSRTSNGGFGTPSWTNFAFPDAAVTSANTVFGKNVLGVYKGPAPTTPYLAVFP